MSDSKQKPLLQVKSLNKVYTVDKGFMQKPAHVKALNNVSFDLYPKQTLAIVGESGSGKSTLAKQIVKLEEPTGGKIIFNDKDVTFAEGAEMQELQKNIRMIFQNPYASLNPRWRVYDILDAPLKACTNLDKHQRKTKIYDLLARVGLDDSFAKRYPHMFSGGQRQRIAIARALILDPEIVVADEAIAALDVTIQAQILELLKELQDQLNVTYLFISHDLGVVKNLCDEILVMYFGHAIEYGTVDDVYRSTKHPYTKALLESTPKLNQGKRTARKTIKGELPSPFNPPQGCPFHSRCPLATEICKRKMPELRMVDNRQVACHHAEKV